MSESDLERIEAISGGYRASQILLTASRLGVFEAIGTDGGTAEGLAARLDSSPRGIRILLDALVALDLLEKAEGRYVNAPVAFRYLLPDASDSQTAKLHHAARLYEQWSRLDDAVRSGGPVPDTVVDPRLDGSRAAFARAMQDTARASAVKTAEILDLSDCRSCLDIGGGPGLYAIEFARKNPELQVTLLDDEETLEVAGKNVKEAGLEERIHFHAGDAFDGFPEGQFDLILLSNFIHIFGADENREVVERAAGHLSEDGRLVIKDFLVADDRTRPEWALLFAVNMLVNTEAGDCYSEEEVRDWFLEAGLEFEETLAITEKSFLIIGRADADKGLRSGRSPLSD